MDPLQEQILHSASKMFYQLGIRNVSIDEICSDLRISKKTFYSHYAQKEDLVEATIEYNRNKHIESYAKNLKNKNAIDSLIFIIKEIKKTEDCEPHALWYDVQKYYPKVFEKFEKLKQAGIKDGFEQNLNQGIAEGYYRDDLDIELTSFFHAYQLKSTFQMMELSENKFSKKRILDFFFDLIIHLIANEKGLKYMEENYFKELKKQ